MSDGKTPKSSLESGEFRGLQKLSLKGQLAVGFAGVIAMLVTAVIFVSARPTRTDVQATVRQMAPSQVQFAKLQGELASLRVAMQARAVGTSQRVSRLEAMLMKRLDKIDAKLDEIYGSGAREHKRRRR